MGRKSITKVGKSIQNIMFFCPPHLSSIKNIARGVSLDFEGDGSDQLFLLSIIIANTTCIVTGV